jgi:hypothetical protein
MRLDGVVRALVSGASARSDEGTDPGARERRHGAEADAALDSHDPSHQKAL